MSCTCQEAWETHSKHSRDFSLALDQAERASLKWIKTTPKKFKAAWANYEEKKKRHRDSLETYLEARKNCPEHGRTLGGKE